MVLVGAADLLSRASHLMLHGREATLAFAPASILDTVLPSLSVPSTVSSTTPLTPSTIHIPTLGISADVESVGKKADGSMATPSRFDRVGWYALGSKPGSPGNAVLAGHVNNAVTTAGVFQNLSKLPVGSYVTISDPSDRTLVYVVTEVAQYAPADAPTARLFSTTGQSQLVLMTCDGDWDASAHSFDKRFVVYASLTAH